MHEMMRSLENADEWNMGKVEAVLVCSPRKLSPESGKCNMSLLQRYADYDGKYIMCQWYIILLF